MFVLKNKIYSFTMKQIFILWLGAAVITYLAGYLNSATGPYYPVTGTIGIEGEKVSFKFDRIIRTNEDYNIFIRSDKTDVTGVLLWKKMNDKNDWHNADIYKDRGILTASIPAQSPLTECEYKAVLMYNDKEYPMPADKKTVTILFLGEVPAAISILYFIFLYGGLLLAIRTGLDFFNENQKIKKLSLFTLIFFSMHALFMNPLKKSFEIGAVNKNVPDISAIFDVQSLLFLILWIAAVIIFFKVKNPRFPSLISGIITIITFLFL